MSSIIHSSNEKFLQFLLDILFRRGNYVNTMNELQAEAIDTLLQYQTQRLRGLIREIVQCCQDRMLFETEKFGLPQSELKCLMLFENERYLTVKGIAQKMDVAKSRVTKIIDGLLRKKLVQRIDDPNDGRIRLISVTPKGQKKSEEIENFLRGIHQEILLQMEPEEKKGVLSSLEMLRSCMEAVKGQLK